MELWEYDINLNSKLVQADNLSCCTDLVKNDQEKEDVTLLSDNLFIYLLDLDLQNKLKDATYDDLQHGEFEDYIKKNLQLWNNKKIASSDGLIFIDGKQYIPDDMTLKREIVRRYYNSSPAGHPSELETFL